MLFQNIREEQGLVYSINVSLNNRHVPISAYSLLIVFQSDPNNNEKIIKSIDSTIKQIAEGKIDPALFSEAKLKHTNDANENLRRNSFIQSAITDYYLDKEPINNLNRLLSSVEQVTLEDIKIIAQEIMKDNYLEATLLPKP